MKKSKTIIGMVIITFMSIILGFVRESTAVYKLGATWQADSYTFSILLPSFLFSAVGGVISTTFVPLYTDLRINHSENDANKFANTFINIIILIALVLVTIGEINTGYIIKILAPGFKGETFNLSVRLVKIILPSMIFTGALYCIEGILTSYRNLIITSADAIPLHLSIILGLIIIYPKFGLNGAVITVLFGSMFQVLIMIPSLIKRRYRYEFVLDLKNQYLKKGLTMIGPMFIGIMAIQINIMVDRMLASTLRAGSITSLNLASKLNIASYSSLAFLVVIFIFPVLSEHAAKNNLEEFEKSLVTGINIVLSLMLPITLVLIFFRNEIVHVLFGYGKFTNNDINYTAQILLFYSIGTCFLGMRDILNRGFYALKDTKTPMKNGIIAVILNIVINLILIKFMEARGLALGTSTSTIIVSILLLINMKSKIPTMNLKKVYINSSKLLFSGIILYLIMFILSIPIKNVYFTSSLKFNQIIYVSIISAVGVIFYIASMIITKVEGMELVISRIIKKLNKE